MNIFYIMNEACNDGIPESKSNVYRIGDRVVDLGRHRLVSAEGRQANNATGKTLEEGLST
jgi:hypothetical protein